MSATFADHFSDRAEGYAAHRPGYPAALVDLLAEAAPRRGLAWEGGCGSGQLSVSLAERFRRVIGTDASREQLARADRHPRVAYRCELAERSSLPARSVDLAVAAQAAHWFDLGTYYGEVRRVAAPGAAVALVTYGLLRVDAAVDAAVDSFYAGALEGHWPPERRHVESAYRSLPFPFEEIETPEMEERRRWRAADVIGYVETWSAVRSLEGAGRGEALEAFRRALREAWGDPEEPRSVRWPLAARLGRVG